MKKYRPELHITPKYGWINDPNGFCFFKGKYHLYAQYFPYDLRWGPMHWLHFSSKDLIHWKEEGIALKPSETYDIGWGCFSGSAIEKDGKLYVLYTGSSYGKQTQCLAYSEDGHNFTKYEGNPVISQKDLPNGYTDKDFRDPKIFFKNGHYYVLTACRHVKGYSSILLFKTDDLIHYSFVNVLKTFDNPTPLKPDGMVECPDIIFEGDKCALIYSLQHKPQNGDINLIPQAPVSYEVGYLDLDEGVFTAIGKVHALDKGFDCYATQTLSKDGKNYIVWWSNLWDVNYPSEEEGYVGQLSLVKKIRIHDHTLRMEFLPDTPNIIHIDLEIEENMSYLEIWNIIIKFNKEKKLIYVTREDMDACIKTADGNILNKRIFSLPYLDTLYLEASIDHSCVELSFNKGQKFLSILNYVKKIPEPIPVVYKDSQGDLIYAFLDR